MYYVVGQKEYRYSKAGENMEMIFLSTEPFLPLFCPRNILANEDLEF